MVSGAEAIWRSAQGIPVRNLWLLMFYASDLRHLGGESIGTEKQPDELPDLVAEILCYLVERRLRQNLSRGYVNEEAICSRVRGRVDILKTERLDLFRRGLVACRYQDLTINTPRNRYIRVALLHLAALTRARALRLRCRMLAARFEKHGVIGQPPSNSEMNHERFGRHDSQDRPMIVAARLAFDLKIPTEEADRGVFLDPSRDEHWLRRLFEKAVGGFYEVALMPRGWAVRRGMRQAWPVEASSFGFDRILPGMETDVVLEHASSGRRIIVDTKFTNVLRANAHGQAKLKSHYLYQMYAYLRTRENPDDPGSFSTEGLLLHPAVGENLDEEGTIQGHRMRFATVDLAANTADVRQELLARIDLS